MADFMPQGPVMQFYSIWILVAALMAFSCGRRDMRWAGGALLISLLGACAARYTGYIEDAVLFMIIAGCCAALSFTIIGWVLAFLYAARILLILAIEWSIIQIPESIAVLWETYASPENQFAWDLSLAILTIQLLITIMVSGFGLFIMANDRGSRAYRNPI